MRDQMADIDNAMAGRYLRHSSRNSPIMRRTVIGNRLAGMIWLRRARARPYRYAFVVAIATRRGKRRRRKSCGEAALVTMWRLPLFVPASLENVMRVPVSRSAS